MKCCVLFPIILLLTITMTSGQKAGGESTKILSPKLGQSQVLTCRFPNSAGLKLLWFKDDEPLSNTLDGHVTVSEHLVKEDTFIFHILSIRNIVKSDYDVYHCKVVINDDALKMEQGASSFVVSSYKLVDPTAQNEHEHGEDEKGDEGEGMGRDQTFIEIAALWVLSRLKNSAHAEIEDNIRTVIKEGMSAASKQWTKSTVSEGAKEGAKTVIKEAGKNAFKEGAKSAAKEGAKKVAQEGAKTVIKEAGKNAFKEGAKSAAKEGAKKVAQEGAKTVIKEAGKNAFKEGAKSAAKEGVKRAVNEGVKSVAKEGVGASVLQSATVFASETTKTIVNQGGTSFAKKIITTQGPVGIVLTLAEEAYHFVNHRSESQEKLEKGEISETEYNLELAGHAAKGVATGSAVLVGSTIGQALIPVPVVGGVVGAMGGKAVVWMGEQMLTDKEGESEL